MCNVYTEYKPHVMKTKLPHQLLTLYIIKFDSYPVVYIVCVNEISSRIWKIVRKWFHKQPYLKLTAMHMLFSETGFAHLYQYLNKQR